MTVTASDDAGIDDVKAYYVRPQELRDAGVGHDFHIACSPTPVSTVGGTFTCTGTKTLTPDQYSGTYQINYVHLWSTEPIAPSRWSTQYMGPGSGGFLGRIEGHGRTGSVGVWGITCCHELNMPDIVVTGHDYVPRGG